MELGISNESLSRWIRLSHERPAGTPLAADERAELDGAPAPGQDPRDRARDPAKSSRLLRSGDRADPVTRFRFVEQEKARYPVRVLCTALGVSPSGYYAWRSRGPSARERSDAALAAEIRGFHAPQPRHVRRAPDLGRPRRGRAPRVAQAGRPAHGARPPRGRPPPAVRAHDDPRRARGAVPRPRQPRLHSHRSRPALGRRHHRSSRRGAGSCYLAAITDAWSRRVVGWSMATHMRAELVTAALDAAVVRRRPPGGLIHHSDHGTQYTSLAFGQRLRESGIAASMGSVGDCYDNAMAESFFATLETELIDRSDWANPDRGEGCGVRVHRGLLQPDPPPQQPRQPQSRAVRGALSFESGRQGRVTHHRPRNRGNST